MPHKHTPDRVLMVVKRVVQAAHVAALDPEDHIDPGVFEDANDPLGGKRFAIQQLFDFHTGVSPISCRFCRPFLALDDGHP
jgi:hypothetical protein